jgi:hypothetical protein
MRKSPITIAIATALLAAGHVSATAALPHTGPQTSETSRLSIDAPLDVRYVRQSELAEAVVSTGNTPSGWKTSASLRNRPLATLSHEADPIVAWIPSDSLVSESARVEAARIIQTGVPVLVSRRDGSATHEARTFGVEVPGSLVLYNLLPDGSTHIVTTGKLAPENVSTATVQNVLALAREASQTPSTSATDVANVDTEAPVKKYTVRASSAYGTGASVAMHVTVARDTTKSHDRKAITVITKALAKPFKNGVSRFEWPLTDKAPNIPPMPFRAHGADRLLYLVGEYRLATTIAWPLSDEPKISTAVEHKPVGSGSTDHDFTDSLTTTTTYGVSVSAELGAQLADKGISAAGKIAPTISYQKQRSEQHSITVKLADYAIAVERKSDPKVHAQSIAWTYPLNSRLANDWIYFTDGTWKVGTKKMTPMMRQADLETVSGWTVDGAYEGQVTLTAGAEIQNTIFVGNSSSAYTARDRPQGEVRCAGSVVECLVRELQGFQPLAEMKIDLGSPYLTRTPTVLLQSFAVEDGCLTQSDLADGSPVSLARCDTSEDNRKQQWTIDEEGRYVNRGSKMCLQMANTGGAVATRCSLALTQKWTWRADRIHSAHNGGRSRLYVTNGRVQAGFDSSMHQDLPINPTNDLLPPWSNYPQKPVVGAFVPGFTFNGEPIPEAYLGFNPVNSAERWETVVLRPGLVR